MSFLTDRKRVEGLGATGRGTDHHWHQMISSAALLILIPLFVFTFGPVLGSSYAEVLAYYSRPVPATIAALTLLVSFYHFKNGATVLIEDYLRGGLRKGCILGVTILSYAAAALGVLAIVRLAL